MLAAPKVRCAGAARAVLCGRVRYEGTVEQLDTRFVVPAGRLKIREVAGVTAELIYRRSRSS